MIGWVLNQKEPCVRRWSALTVEVQKAPFQEPLVTKHVVGAKEHTTAVPVVKSITGNTGDTKFLAGGDREDTSSRIA